MQKSFQNSEKLHLFKTRLKKLNFRLSWPTLCSFSQKSSEESKKFSYVGFRSKLRPLECMQISSSDEDLMWDFS